MPYHVLQTFLQSAGHGMLNHMNESESRKRLRTSAEGLLERGAAPPTRGWTTGGEALALLHRLASAPGSASDALKLLHELQVHQVELDLQYEQLEQNRHELNEQLEHCTGLFDNAPFGYCSVDAQGRINQGNHALATVLGAAPDALGGKLLGNFLAPESRPVLSALLDRVKTSGSRQTCRVACGDGTGSPRLCRVVAAPSPEDGKVLLGITETPGE